MKVGDRVFGKVCEMTSYGAFLKVGKVKGLLHVHDMSWGTVSHPSEVIRNGENIKVVVLSIDESRDRYSFGIKQLQTNPWSYADKKFKVGKRYNGTVINMIPTGVFVKLDESITGYLHKSKGKWHNYPTERFKIGDKVTVKVEWVDTERGRVSLMNATIGP